MKNFIIVALAFICIYLSFQTPDKEYVPVDRVIVKDSISYSEVIDTLYLPSDIEIDTAGIIEKYLMEFRVKREFKDDIISLRFTDTLRYNTLIGGEMVYTLTYPEAQPYQYGLGLVLNTYSGIGFGGMYSKNRFNYTMYYFPGNTSLQVGVMFKF